MAQQIAKRILLRLPPDVAAALDELAKRERRSINDMVCDCILGAKYRDAQSVTGVKVDYLEVKECVQAAIKELRLQGQFRELDRALR